MRYLINIITLCVFATLAGCCLSNEALKEDVPKFARWEIDSLIEISPMTPVAEGVKGTQLAQKWSLTVMIEGTTKTEYSDGSYSIAPNQSEIDKQQYIDFKNDGSFVLSITETACSELKNKIQELFGI